MQSDSGLLRWLNVPFVYNAFSAAVGANALRRRLIQNHVRAKPGDKVIDIGCGSALALQWLPEVAVHRARHQSRLYRICQANIRHQGHFRSR